MRVDREDVRRGAAAATALAFNLAASAFAREASLQDVAKAAEGLPQIVIYTAKEIVTLDPAKPTAQAVAVVGDRILATGSLDELKAAAGSQPYTVDSTFANHVIVPGFIAQHDHPLLAALTMTSTIIAIEDWVLPQGTSRAAKNHAEYLKRLAEANTSLKDPSEPLVTWGYHQYFHGELKKADVDAISATRPIVVWHRSAHEFFLNTAAEKQFGVTKEWFDALPEGAKKQSDFANAPYWEQGAFAVIPRIASAIASLERPRDGLEFVENYYHANGVTLGCEPGDLASRKMQDAQNAVLSGSATPFRWAKVDISDELTIGFRVDVGGFGLASRLTWQRCVGLGRQLTSSTSAGAGYRDHETDCDRTGFASDTLTHGPMLGLVANV